MCCRQKQKSSNLSTVANKSGSNDFLESKKSSECMRVRSIGSYASIGSSTSSKQASMQRAYLSPKEQQKTEASGGFFTKKMGIFGGKLSGSLGVKPRGTFGAMKSTSIMTKGNEVK
jgi:hypothetical protein